MSTKKLPTLRLEVLEPIGIDVFITNPDITSYPKSYIESDSAVGTTINANGLNFSANDYIVIGVPGSQKTEICKIQSATASAITLSATSVYPHSRGDSIQYIPYNQVVLSYSSDGVTYTPLAGVDILIDHDETYISRTADLSTYYYKYRFYNSTTGLYSSYSESITGTDYTDNTVYSVKKRALDSMGEKLDNLITDRYLNESIREARRIIDNDPRILRWSFRTVFNYALGAIVPGTYRMQLPTDLRDLYSNKNILGVRVGRQSYILEYQDNLRFRQNYYNIPHTTLNGAVVFGATSITLTNSGSFDESGNIVVAGSGVNVDMNTVAYTANDEVTNVISGVTGVPAAGFASGSDVWQNATFGVPAAYTVENGYIYFDLPFDNASDGDLVYIDYYKSISEINDDLDTFDEPFYDLYVSYLRYKIKYKKANGKVERDTDADYMDWTEGTTRLINQELSGQTVRFVPDINGYSLR